MCQELDLCTAAARMFVAIGHALPMLLRVPLLLHDVRSLFSVWYCE